MKLFVKVIALILLFSGCSKNENSRYTDVVELSLPKTVTIYVSTDKGRAMGAGVYVSSNGHILTCAHLFTFAQVQSISVETYDGYIVAAELLHMHVKRDLALIKTDQTDTQFVKVASPAKLRVGQEVIAIGAPLGNTFSVSNGIISALNRDHFLYNALQTNANINPGNSGGPLLNLNGELVGINSFIESPLFLAPVFTGLGFAVECGQIIEFLGKFRGLENGAGFKIPLRQESVGAGEGSTDTFKRSTRRRVGRHNLPNPIN